MRIFAHSQIFSLIIYTYIYVHTFAIAINSNLYKNTHIQFYRLNDIDSVIV